MNKQLYSSQQKPHRHLFLLLIGLFFSYLVSRLVFLTQLPVFVDEAMHIQWARETIGGNLTVGLWVGKWLPVKIMALFTLLPFDPLHSARLASVSMGLATLIACILISRELFSLYDGLLSGFVYTILPFALLYDRLALADVYLTAFGAWSLLLSILLIKRRAFVYILALCLVTAAGILSKLTGGLFLVTPLLVGTFLVRQDNRVAYFKRTIPVFVSGLIVLMLLMWRECGTQLVTAQSTFRTTTQLDLFLSNISLSFQWFTVLLTPVLALLMAAATIFWIWFGVTRKTYSEIFLIALFLISFIPYALISAIWFPRYLLFTVVPISLLLSRTITMCASIIARLAHMMNKAAITIAIVALLTAVSASLNWDIITDPEKAALPAAETEQYIKGWASGYGLPQLAEFLYSQAQEKDINIVRFYFWHPPNQGLDVYLNTTKSMHGYTLNPFDTSVSATISDLANMRRTLFISNPEGEKLQGVSTEALLGKARCIWSYTRPGSESHLEVWEVFPQDETP